MERPPPIPRQTFIALRARRQSHRVVAGLLHPPLDPYQFFCRYCGRPLDGLNVDNSDQIRCETCGWRTEVPWRGATELRRRRSRRWGRRPRTPFRDAAVLVYLLIAVILLIAAL